MPRNNHDLDVDDLVVKEASVGKNLVMKRFHARARGNAGGIEKFFSQIHHRGRREARRSAQGRNQGRCSEGQDGQETSGKRPAKKTCGQKGQEGTT